jgi:hypothetical protein
MSLADSDRLTIKVRQGFADVKRIAAASALTVAAGNVIYQIVSDQARPIR